MRIRQRLDKLKALNFSLIDQIITSGSNFFGTLIIVKLLGLNVFGIFSAFWILLLFISTIFVSSIISPMMAIIPGCQNIKKYIGSLLIFQLVFSFGAFIVSFLIALFYFKISAIETPIKTTVIFSFCVLFHHLQEFFRKYFFAMKVFLNAIIIDSITYLIRFILLFILFYLENDTGLNTVFLIYLSTSLLGSIYGICKYKFEIDSSCIKKDYILHLNISKWLIPSGLLKWSSTNLFLVSTSILLGPVSLGIIKLSQNIISVYNLFLLGLENFIPLETARVYSHSGLASLLTYIKKVALNGVIFTLVFGGLVALFSSTIIEVTYGENFTQYSYILYWFASCLIFMYLNSIINIFLITINKTKITFQSYVYTSFFSCIIFYPLIYYFEITGVLAGMFCSYVFLVLISLKQINKNRYDIR